MIEHLIKIRWWAAPKPFMGDMQPTGHGLGSLDLKSIKQPDKLACPVLDKKNCLNSNKSFQLLSSASVIFNCKTLHCVLQTIKHLNEITLYILFYLFYFISIFYNINK